ncbi:MAG: hypothetical protein WC223_06435 [Bacteroidales bacterium]|jgi:hypothetical protein
MKRSITEDIRENKIIYVNEKYKKICIDKDFNVIYSDLIYKFPVSSKANKEILEKNNFKLFQNN